MSPSRRKFLQATALTGLGLSLSPTEMFSAPADTNKVRLGFIGVGLRGQSHLELALQRADVDVVAICDIQQRMIDMSKDLIKKSGKKMPAVIMDGPYGYKKLLENKDIDAVIIATPWEWHYVMCIDAMNAGKYVGCEVMTGSTVEECWELVHTSERTGKPMMMLENVCYRRDVMAVMNMVRQNVFGEIIHLQGGYQHDLRDVKFNDGKEPYGHGVEFGEKAFSEAQWRTQHSVKPNEVEGLNPAEGFDPTYNDIRYIKNWQVSEPAKLEIGHELSNSAMPDIQTRWQPIVVERRGLVNLTRLYGHGDSRQYVWLRSKIISKTSRKMKIDLGFSDEVWVFLNDRTVFVDKNLYGQGMRKNPDGRISPMNASFEIQLNEGENDLVVGVANDFFGWGIIAHVDDLNGITLSNEYKQEVVNTEFEKYFGLYSTRELQLKLKVSQKNGKLSVLPTAESPILFEKTGDDTFYSDQTKITVEFDVAANKMTLKTGSQTFVLTRE